MDTIDVAVVYVDGPAAFFLLPPWRERGLGGAGGGREEVPTQNQW